MRKSRVKVIRKMKEEFQQMFQQMMHSIILT